MVNRIVALSTRKKKKNKMQNVKHEKREMHTELGEGNLATHIRKVKWCGTFKLILQIPTTIRLEGTRSLTLVAVLGVMLLM